MRELYLFKDRTVDKRLKRLVKKRDRLRKRACARVSPQMVKISLAYHEEFDVAWLREMESTLGYPDCYANAYASDRQSHVNIEKRASRQIDDMYQAGRVDPFAYFVGSFFLCTLDCEAASALGRECLEHLRDLRPSLDEIYTSMVAKNLERVRRQLEIMAKYRARTEMELRGLN